VASATGDAEHLPKRALRFARMATAPAADPPPVDVAEADDAVRHAEEALRMAKSRMQALQAEAKEQQQREFDLKKAEAEREIHEARRQREDTRTEIKAAYAEQADAERRAKAIGEEIWSMQQERVMEDLMLKKLRLQKTQERRQKLRDELREQEEQLGSLNAELSRRDVHSNTLLQEALQHADALREALHEAEADGRGDVQARWLRKLHSGGASDEGGVGGNGVGGDGAADGGGGGGGAREAFNMVDELLAQRQQKLRKDSRNKADELRALNEERRQLNEQRHDAARRRQQQERLLAKGREFLAEIEMGEAPPLEFIKLNLSGGEGGRHSGGDEEAGSGRDGDRAGSGSGAGVTAADGDGDGGGAGANDEGAEPPDFAQQEESSGGEAEEDDETVDEMVTRLRTAIPIASYKIDSLRRALAPTDTVLELPGTLDPKSEACQVSSALVGDIVEVVLGRCVVDIKPREAVESERRWWETQGLSLRKDLKRRELADQAWRVLGSLVEEVVQDSVRGLHTEIYELHEMAQSVGRHILLSCVQKACASTRSVTELHRQIASDSAVAAAAAARGAGRGLAALVSPRRRHSMTVTWFVPSDEKPAPRPRRVVKQPWEVSVPELDHDKLEPPSFSGRELSEGFTTDDTPKNVELSGRTGVSCVKLSPSGLLLCVGRLNGEVSVWSQSLSGSGSPNAALEIRTPHKISEAAIVEIGWSMDSTQLYTINTKGMAHLWTMQLVQDAKASGRARKLTLLAQLDSGSFASQRTDLAAQNSSRECTPRTACFHPGLTAMGTQPSLVLGMLNGDVVKCTNPTAADRAINVTDLSKSCGAELNHPSGGEASQPQRRRSFSRMEFFSAHKAPIVFTGFGPGNTMITMDNTGKILSWPYTRDHFTGYKWFHPNRACDLGLSHTFSPVAQSRPVQIFPADATAPPVPSPLLDPQHLRQVRAATEAVANLRDLAFAPCAHTISDAGTHILTYPPRKPEGGFQAQAECTVLEYGAGGAGAGLLLRHSTQVCTVSPVARGGMDAHSCPITSNHLAFTPSRSELYILVSSEPPGGGGESTLSIVGLSVKEMRWLPMRVGAGTASKAAPAISVFQAGGVAGQVTACVLNGYTVSVISLRSGRVMKQVKSSTGPWDSMDWDHVNSTLALSSGERNVVNLYQWESAAVNEAAAVLRDILDNVAAVATPQPVTSSPEQAQADPSALSGSSEELHG
jgi:hypothetical protein